MKGFKVLLVIMAAALVTFGLSGVSFAFHDGGVAYCDGCHTMHNAQGTTSMLNSNYKGTATQFSGNIFLLQGTDQSSTCLNCHGAVSGTSVGAISAPVVYTTSGISGVSGAIPTNYTPGGDYAWLLVVPATSTTTTGYRRGHNIVAYDYTLTYSPLFTSSPGGSYPSTTFYCSSCHDPHGTYRHSGGDATKSGDVISPVFHASASGAGAIEGSGSYGEKVTTSGDAIGVYRLLAGMNYLPASISSTTAATFSYDSPVAVSPSSFNSNTWSPTNMNVIYGSGMSQWCANCHPKVLANALMGSGGQAGGDTNLIHPVGSAAVLGEATVGSVTLMYNYVNYVYTGNMSGSGGMSGYSSLVPIEVGDNTTGSNLPSTGNLTQWQGSATGVTLSATNTTDNVLCLTCHRAHASAFQNMTRWDNTAQFLTSGGVFAQGTYKYSTAASGSQSAAAYYNAPVGTYLGSYQRSLCDKCHAKD